MTRPCDVHRLVHRDVAPKRDVFFCSRCGAWICADCQMNWNDGIAEIWRRAVRRAEAAFLHALGVA